MNVWTCLLASFGFGLGWEIRRWYRGFEAATKHPKLARFIHDLAIACLLAPPAAIIGLFLLSNTRYFEPVARWSGLIG